jgi:YD repeat-containing protein
MRSLIFFLLLPLSIFCQELPDSSIASKLGIKKLIILQQSRKSPVDTFGVFILDGTWKNQNEAIDTSAHADSTVIISDSNGRTTFTWDKRYTGERKCTHDSVGILMKYDQEGKLIQYVYYTCMLGKIYLNYYYDEQGKLLLVITPSDDIGPGTRDEYKYDKQGRLISITSWMTENPMSAHRVKEDILETEIIFSYDKNGLIKETQLDDPENDLYNIKADYEDLLPKMKFTYIYIY